MNNFKWIIVCLVLALFIYGCANQIARKKHDKTPSRAELTVSVKTPLQQITTQNIDVTGIVVPRQESIVTTELSGIRIRQIYSDVGDTVIKGQKLAILDCDSLQSQLVEASNDYESKQDEYSRVEKLATKGMIPIASVVQKRAIMQSAQARLNHAELTIKHCELIAPESGFIFERKAIIGGLVNSNEPLYRIASHSKVELEVNVPEADLAKLKIGQDATMNITGHTKILSGQIRLITPEINPNSRTAAVRISLEKSTNFQIGLFANASIQTGQISGQTLPITALQHDQSGTYVWRLAKGNIVTRQPVTVLDYHHDTFTLQALSKDSRVIVRAGAFVKTGDLVNPVDIT